MKRCGLEAYFSVIHTCEEAGADKMQPDIYLKCSKALGVPVANTLVVEDAVHAMQTAKLAGYYIAGIYDAESEREQDEVKQLSDVYVNEKLQYEEIITWLKKQSIESEK